MGFFRKKEEKKKFDYSEETKDLFAERDAFYAEQRRQMGGSDTNPELANQSKPEPTTSREEDVENLLGGGGDFNPYVDSNQDSEMGGSSVPPSSPPASTSSSAFVCTSCGKEFQEKWGKCPSCGGEMKKAEAAPAPSPVSQPSQAPASDSSGGDPLDDLLGDFGSSAPSPSEDTSSEIEDSSVKMVDSDDLTSDFGESISSHSNRRKVRKVRKVKRSRKQL